MFIPHSRPTLDESDIKSVSEVIRSGYIVQGPMVRKFEREIAHYIGVRGAVAVSSGTAALHLGLLALGLKRGDEVILPSFVCLAPLNAIRYIGVIPQICDINYTDFNISVKEVKKKINRRTKAIIVAHMFGMPADIDDLLELDIPIVEDCAHSIGATFKDKKVGSFGTISVLSFYATKMLTSGEGGMVCSNSPRLLKKIQDMRQYDEKEKMATYFNYKMTDLQAALGLNQLRKLPSYISKRKKLASRYNTWFSPCNIELPTTDKNKKNVFYRYIIKLKQNINKTIKDLEKKDIACRRPVYKPLHRYLKLKGFPFANKAWNCSLSIPCYPSLTQTEIKRIKDALRNYF